MAKNAGKKVVQSPIQTQEDHLNNNGDFLGEDIKEFDIWRDST